ncbi:MAG: TetR/AcrR family transcriptional regulator [Vicinamibacterales bacterium]
MPRSARVPVQVSRRAARPRPAPAAASPRRGRRPGPAPSTRRPAAAVDANTRSLIFAAAAAEFSRHGFDGASVDAIARAAHVNKAMLYYHFASKLGLYREIVRDMLRAVGAEVTAIAASDAPPPAQIARFVQTLASLKEARPWFPPLMLREMSAGAPHLDADTLSLLRAVFAAFGGILEAGAAAGVFRRVHPVLAYMSILGPMMMNAVRERAAAEHGRLNLPLFVPVPAGELVAHMQHTALCMLDPARSPGAAARPAAGAKDRP